MIDAHYREDRPVPAESIKQEIAEKFLNALRSHNWELMRTIMAPDIVWSLPGSSRISGEAQGVDAVIARCQIITSYGLNFALKHVLYGQFGFALSLNNTAKCGDIVLDEHLATVCSLREEKIGRLDTYLSDLPMANAFFA